MKKAKLFHYNREVLKRGEKGYLSHLAGEIKAGKVVIMPSDTIYGFMCIADCEERVREIKRRDSKPFLYLIDSMKRLEEMDIDYERYRPLLDKNWPGPFTFLLENRAGVKLGLRLPEDRAIRELVALTGEPLLSTSVNYSGEPALLEVDSIIKEFGTLVDLIVVKRDHPTKSSSTIVDYDGKEYKIVREGNRKLVC